MSLPALFAVIVVKT